MGSAIKRNRYEGAVRAYHTLPLVTAVVFVVTFIGTLFLTRRYFLSGITAVVPSFLLMLWWTASARQVDEWLKGWACSKCARPLPKRMYWSYPPSRCPNCGERVT